MIARSDPLRGRGMFRRLLLGLALVLPAVPAEAQESLLDTVLKRDKLIVATYSTSPPLAYVDDNGKLVGFEIDMAHEIAKDLLGDPEKVSRRDHLSARPRARRRGAGGNAAARGRRHDDGRRHSRDELCPRHRRPDRLHGWRHHRRGGQARSPPLRTADRARSRLPQTLQRPLPDLTPKMVRGRPHIGLHARPLPAPRFFRLSARSLTRRALSSRGAVIKLTGEFDRAVG